MGEPTAAQVVTVMLNDELRGAAEAYLSAEMHMLINAINDRVVEFAVGHGVAAEDLSLAIRVLRQSQPQATGYLPQIDLFITNRDPL